MYLSAGFCKYAFVQHVWRELHAEHAAGELRLHLDEDVGHKRAAHLEVVRRREEEGARLEKSVDGEAAVVQQRVQKAVLAAEVGLAAVGEVEVGVACDPAGLL